MPVSSIQLQAFRNQQKKPRTSDKQLVTSNQYLEIRSLDPPDEF